MNARLFAILAVVALGGSGLAVGQEEAALTIHDGSVVGRQVVALGRDLIVDGTVLSDAATINGDARITGTVEGDLILLGGNAHLSSTADVQGDLFVLGGAIELEEGAQIGGQSVSYPTFNSAWLTLMEGPALGLPVFSPVVLGAKLALMAAWMTLLLLLLASSGYAVLQTSEGVRLEPFRNFVVGLVAVLALALTAVFLSAFTTGMGGGVAGVPLLGLLVLVALLLKLWGLVAVFHALGEWAARSVLRRRMSVLNAAVLGLVLLGGLKLVPWLGIWTWSVATLIGVGAALTSKFGRRETWFEPSHLERLASLSAS